MLPSPALHLPVIIDHAESIPEEYWQQMDKYTQLIAQASKVFIEATKILNAVIAADV